MTASTESVSLIGDLALAVAHIQVCAVQCVLRSVKR